MTTIAVNKDMIAGDSQATNDGLISNCRKVFKVNNQIVGFAGTVTYGKKFVDWLKNKEADKPVMIDFEAIVLLPDGTMEYWDEAMFPDIITDDYYAIGSGAHLALGAMAAGASPTEAVKIACKRDDGSSGPVKTIRRPDE